MKYNWDSNVWECRLCVALIKHTEKQHNQYVKDAMSAEQTDKTTISVRINGEHKVTFPLSPGDCITLTKDTDNVAQYTVPHITHFHYFVTEFDKVKRLCVDDAHFFRCPAKKVAGYAKWCRYYKHGVWQEVE